MILENIKKFINKVLKLFEKYSHIFSSFGLVLGLIVTPITLQRIDNFGENLWIILHLFIAIFGIFVLNFLDNKINAGKIDKQYQNSIIFWSTLVIQFAFGNLFSTYIIFYFKSSSLSTSWPFILLILFILIGNEIWKKHYSRLVMQVSTLFLSIYMFIIFFLPIIIHRIGDDIFIYSGITSLFITGIIIFALWKITKEKFIKSKKALLFSILGTFVFINIFYFLNIIPPIPISLKEAGVYYNVTKDPSGFYILEEKKKDWTDFFKITDVFERYNNEPVYFFSAIFSPTKFDTYITHEWNHYDKKLKKWINVNKINLPIVGGRDNGYRTYSLKSNITEGLWEVKVKTKNNRVVGRVRFEVKNVTQKPVVEFVNI
jgi:hypothetical protein